MRNRSSMERVFASVVVCVLGCDAEGGGVSAGSGGSGAGAAASVRVEAGSGAGRAAQSLTAGVGGAGGSGGNCLDVQVDCNGVCVGSGSEGGGCTLLAATGKGVDVQRMALDDSHVYWAEQGIRTAIARAPKAGGHREQLIETDNLPGELAVNSASVIWSEGITTRRLRFAAKTGGTPVDLVASVDEISALIATDLSVYFASGTTGGQGVLESISLDGMARTAHGKAAIWPNAAWVAIDDRALYWSVSPGEIRSTTLTGQDLATLTSPPLTSAILLKDFNLYVTHGNQGEKSLSRLAADSGERSLIFAGPEVGGRLGSSGTTLYFGDSSKLYALTPGDAKPELAFSTKSMLRFWVADETGVYAALRTTVGETLVVKVR